MCSLVKRTEEVLHSTAKDAKMNHLGAKMNQCMGALLWEFLINFQNEMEPRKVPSMST